MTLLYVGGALGGLLPGLLWLRTGWWGVVALLMVVLAIMAWLGARYWR
jgi:hypothetical protein